jgi:small conductance mechanosensitive channel
MEDYQEVLTQGAGQAVDLLSTWGLKVLGALAVLIIGRWISGRLSKATKKALERARIDATLVPFFSNLVYYLALAITLIAVLNLFGIETTSLIAVLGAATVAIGLALQGTLSSFAAGVMLLIFRPFKIGDFVDIGGVLGSVREIALFTTHLNTPDNVAIIVPNSEVFGKIIRNFSANSIRRQDISMGIGYDDNIGVAMATLQKVLDADNRVHREPAPFLGVTELADSSVNILVRFWCDAGDFFVLKTDLLRAFKESLEAAGCSIPYPQQDIHLHKT